jgi:hypothetical protein
MACKQSGSFSIDEIETIDDVATACEEYTPIEVTQTIEFTAQPAGCPWGTDDNMQVADGFMTARNEQTQSLQLPDDALICDMRLSFGGGVEIGEIQNLIYDDHFFFMFNDVILASSIRDMVDVFRADANGMHRYEWDTIRGMGYHQFSPYENYCLGDDDEETDCDIPETEVPGPISINFGDSTVDLLSLLALDEQRAEFTMVATGDDDANSDCSHGAITFDVTVPYLQP